MYGKVLPPGFDTSRLVRLRNDPVVGSKGFVDGPRFLVAQGWVPVGRQHRGVGEKAEQALLGCAAEPDARRFLDRLQPAPGDLMVVVSQSGETADTSGVTSLPGSARCAHWTNGSRTLLRTAVGGPASAASPRRRRSATMSLSLRFSWTARILSARTSSSGRSMVVFTSPSLPANQFDGSYRPLSLFSNVNAGLLEAHDTHLTTLLPTEPRPVHYLIVKAVDAGGHRSRSR